MGRSELRVVARNIEALIEARGRFEERKTFEQRVADAITKFAGSMWSVYAHGLLYGGWILLNTGIVPGVKPWDPFPFVMLAMAASVEAIFLSTFVLISQNRMGELADRRADLDLQINLLSEHEITRLLDVSVAIANKLGVEVPEREEVDALRQPVAPEKVLEEIEEAQAQGTEAPQTSR